MVAPRDGGGADDWGGERVERAAVARSVARESRASVSLGRERRECERAMERHLIIYSLWVRDACEWECRT